MKFASPTAQSATPPLASSAVPYPPGAFDDEDLALGWECANPSLQIDVWRTEASAQPLQEVY